MDLKPLIILADRVLAASDDEHAVALLTEYTDAFASWQNDWIKKHPAGTKVESPEKEAVAPLLRTLDVKHRQIVNRTAHLRGDVLKQMRELKRRGKGILQYTDDLPKQIGSIKPRKL